MCKKRGGENHKLIYFIAKDRQPISVVQEPGFKHMIKALEQRYQVPHRKTLTEKILHDEEFKILSR